MKPTLEIQEVVAALGIDPFRFLAWQEQELQLTGKMNPYIEEPSTSNSMYGLVI